MVTRRSLLAGGVVTGGAAAVTGAPVFSVTAHAAVVGDETDIQAALNKARDAGGGVVNIGPGTWNIVKKPLRIYGNTRLALTPATRFVRTGAVTAILSNGPRDGSDTTTGGYNGSGNIIVEGGIWDFNCNAVPQAGWGIVIAHARNITIRDLEIRDVSEWHAIELNSTYNALVSNCRLIGSIPRADSAWNQEAVSIDLAAPGLVPHGLGDNTQSAHIRIVDNYCTGWPTFAGAHTGVKGGNHDHIVVSGNTVRDLTFWGVSFRNASNVVISDNTITGVGGGIWIRPHIVAATPEARPVNSVAVTGNVINGVKNSDGIRLIGEVAGAADGRIYDAVVTGNTVSGVGWHGINIKFAPGVVVTSNKVRNAPHNGIFVTGGRDELIAMNSVVDSGLAGADNAIQLSGGTNPTVQGNKVTSTDPAKRPANAIASDNTSNGVACLNNDLRNGYANAALDLQGTGHHNAGNLA